MDIDNVKQPPKLLSMENGRLKLKIVPQRFIYFVFSCLVIASLFEPSYIAHVGNLFHTFFVVLKYVSSGLVIVLFFINRTKLNSFILWFLSFEGALLVATILNLRNGTATISNWVSDSAYSIILILFLQLIFNFDPEMLLSSFSTVLGLYVHINTICRLLFPGGMYVMVFGSYRAPECWFLGYDNVAVVIILIVQIISLYRISINKEKLMLWDWSIVITGIFFIFVQTVATAILAEVAFFALLILIKNNFCKKYFAKAKLVVVVMFIMFLIMQMVTIQEKGIISYLFSLLGKDVTFNHRTTIWSRAIEDILNGHLIYGFGTVSSSVVQKRLGMDVAVHVHSYYLQVIYEGGLIAFFLVLVMLLVSAAKFDKAERKSSSFIILAGLLAIMLSWQVEASNNLSRFFFIILFMIYNISTFEKIAAPESDKIRRRRIRFRI